ncbi:hypothetical protein OIU78_002803 [Salix suchowensis]|nr:hypothetical protein OIU78_002803 [Salix suchowensis]
MRLLCSTSALHRLTSLSGEDIQYTIQCTTTLFGWKSLGTLCFEDILLVELYYHLASVWGLLTLQLADEEFLPFDYLSYASELQEKAKELEDEISDRGTRLAPLFESIKKLRDAATKINQERKGMEEKRVWPWVLKRDKVKVREINDRLMMAERAFTDAEGLSGRPWYKHLIYAPSKHDDYGSNYFPGIDDAIEKAESLGTPESWHSVQHQVWRVSRAVRHVSQVLNGELT